MKYVLKSTLKSFPIHDQIGECLQVVDRSPVAHLWPFNAKGFGLTVDPFARRSLYVHLKVEVCHGPEDYLHLHRISS